MVTRIEYYKSLSNKYLDGSLKMYKNCNKCPISPQHPLQLPIMLTDTGTDSSHNKHPTPTIQNMFTINNNKSYQQFTNFIAKTWESVIIKCALIC